MNMKERLDPELVEPLENLMTAIGGGFDLVNLDATRQMVAGMAAGLKADAPPMPGVEIDDMHVPAGSGSPGVTVRLYRPAAAGVPPAVLLWMHPGGWVIGNLDLDELMLRQLVADVGCAVVSVDYRLSPEHPYPAAIEDCYAALEWIASQGSNLGVDAGRIAVGGSSGGGGLAAGLALLARDRAAVAPLYQMLIYPSINDRNIAPAGAGVPENFFWSRANTRQSWQAYLGDRLGRDDVPVYAAPFRATDLSGLPPAYIAVGGLDMFLADNLDYASRLTAAGVNTEVHVYPGAFHAFDAFAPMSGVAQRFVVDRNSALRRAFAP
jgi:acetyl esterase/lipase